MAGTRAGGLKAWETSKQRYGVDFFRTQGLKSASLKIAHKGYGSKKTGKDGLTGRQRASRDGRKGRRQFKADKQASVKAKDLDLK